MGDFNKDIKLLHKQKKYYICKKATIITRMLGTCNSNVAQLTEGMLLEAVEIDQGSSLKACVKDESNPLLWENTEWKCHPIDLLEISETLFKFLLPIENLKERLILVNNKQLCEDIETVKCDSKVWYSPDPDKPNPQRAVVKYIGPVENRRLGHYFGLQLVDHQATISRNSKISRENYNSSQTFATLSNINPTKTEAYNQIKIFEQKFLCHDLQSTSNSFFTQPATAKTNFLENSYQKKKETIFNNENFSLFNDTDNNNQYSIKKNALSEQQLLTTNYNTTNNQITKNETIVQSQLQNDNNKSLYNNLKSFDPLNSDDDREEDVPKPLKSKENKRNGDLSIGSCVKVVVENDTHDGVIRWIGVPKGSAPDRVMAAIELDESHPLANDGIYNSQRYIRCPPKRAWFTELNNCHQYDFIGENCYPKGSASDCMQSNVIIGLVPPISVHGDVEENKDLNKICGKYRGIQGHHNSCYLDATLFSMFAFTSVFDSLLFRPPGRTDCREYKEVQRVLREEIVNPLRKDLYVSAGRVMKLRTLLEKLSSISGLTSEEKDPEEFLTSLVAQILCAEPFLKLSSNQEAYHYQLFVEKDDRLTLPTVQQLLEQSFLTSNIRLKEVPSCLIIQMPRFGKSYKMYPKIQPTLMLDITDIIIDSPRQCTVCAALAVVECKQCFGKERTSLESIAFCKKCFSMCHQHDRKDHIPQELTVPEEFEILKQHYTTVPRLYLELLAVVCIETSHYVSFVKCGSGSEAPWCFFDSMADRKGEQNGFNIPEMVPCPDFPFWLSEDGAASLNKSKDDRKLPEHAKRLLCDAYMCMYQSPDVMMYK